VETTERWLYQLPKLDVAGSIPVARSKIIFGRISMAKSQDTKKDTKKKPAKSAKEKKLAKQEKKNK